MAQHEAEQTKSQLKQEAEKSKIKLLTQRELIKGSITRFKKVRQILETFTGQKKMDYRY